MKKYVTPSIEKETVEAEDIILSSGSGIGGGVGELPVLPVDAGAIGGSTGKITIGGTTTGGFSAGDLFGNR